MPFLSISIDLSGSTTVKQTLVELSEDDSTYRNEMYEEYLSLLFSIERNFYSFLIKSPAIDFSKLTLVKSIGDEFWYVYDVTGMSCEESRVTAWAFFDVLLAVFAEERYLAFQRRPETDDGERLPPDTFPVVQFSLPVKAYIDLIQDSIEINVERYQYLKDVVSLLKSAESTVFDVDEDYVALCGRLNLGSPETFGGRHRVQTRADYIGLEVDRFFRLTKACKSLLLCVGEQLMRIVDAAVEPVAPDLEHIGVRILTSNLDGQPALKRKYVISEKISAASMKGISADYLVHHLFDGRCIGEAAYAGLPAMHAMMAPTRAFLAENGFYALDRHSLIV